MCFDLLKNANVFLMAWEFFNLDQKGNMLIDLFKIFNSKHLQIIYFGLKNCDFGDFNVFVNCC
jgi:hypothetical protein